MKDRKTIRDFIKWQIDNCMLKDELVIAYEMADSYLEEVKETADKRQKLTAKFQKWLDTNPNKNLVARQCAFIAEDYCEEQLKLTTQKK